MGILQTFIQLSDAEFVYMYGILPKWQNLNARLNWDTCSTLCTL